MLNPEQQATLSRLQSEVELWKAEISQLTYPDGSPLGDVEQNRLLVLRWLNQYFTENKADLLGAIAVHY